MDLGQNHATSITIWLYTIAQLMSSIVTFKTFGAQILNKHNWKNVHHWKNVEHEFLILTNFESKIN
jgi:hypothetical protein